MGLETVDLPYADLHPNLWSLVASMTACLEFASRPVVTHLFHNSNQTDGADVKSRMSLWGQREAGAVW